MNNLPESPTTEIETEVKAEPETTTHNNLKLVQEYANSFQELIDKSIDISVTKLGFVIVLSTCSICFSVVSPSYTNVWALSADIASNILCLIAILLCFAGFYPKSGGFMALPDVMLNEHYYDSEEDFRLILTRTVLEGLPSLIELRDFRANVVKSAFSLLCAAILCKAVARIGIEILLILR